VRANPYSACKDWYLAPWIIDFATLPERRSLRVKGFDPTGRADSLLLSLSALPPAMKSYPAIPSDNTHAPPLSPF